VTVSERAVPGHMDHGGCPTGGQGDHAHDHGGHASLFRDRFWLSPGLSVPVVVYSTMVRDWFGYSAPAFRGEGLVAPVLGTLVYLYGGWPFLAGAVEEVRGRHPGMMLLIAMAITVAFAASWATSLGLFGLDFWWELAALVVIMLLGHWMEMRALGQARGALPALAELLPDAAERVRGDDVEVGAVSDLVVGDVVLVRPGGRVPADGELLSDAAEFDESMVTGSRARWSAWGARPWLPARCSPARWPASGWRGRRCDSAGGDSAACRRGGDLLVADAGAGGPRRGAAVLHRDGHGGDHLVGMAAAGRRCRRGGDAYDLGAGDLLPARARAGDPAGDRAGHVAGRPPGHPRARPAKPGAHARRRHGAVRQDRDTDAGRTR
jgi:E1-E2 ATPase